MMELPNQIADYVRDYFESPRAILTPETDLVAAFGAADPDGFSDFLEDVSKRFGIRRRELRDMSPGADDRPPGVIHFLWDVFFRKVDMEVVYVERLTLAELIDIANTGEWPEKLPRPISETR